MAKKTSVASLGGYDIGRLVEQSGGMVDNVVYPTLLKDNEAALLSNVSLDEKGTIKTCKGRTERFALPFDADNPCNGLSPFYPDPASSRLVFGAGTKLYKDTPHLLNRWTDQADFEEAGTYRVNCDTTSTPGEVKRKSHSVTQTGSPYAAFGALGYALFNAGEYGWAFDVTETLTVSGFRIYARHAASYAVRLWKDSDQSRLAEKTISVSTADQWASASLGSSVTLTPGRYVVSVALGNTTHNHDTSPSAGTFNRVLFVEGRRSNTPGSFPATAVTFTAGIVDIIISSTSGAAITFTRASDKYKSDGTRIPRNSPCYEAGKYGNGLHVSEGTTNLLTENQSSVETDTAGFEDVSGGTATLTRVTTEHWHGSASLHAVKTGAGNICRVSGGVQAAGDYTFSCMLKGSGRVRLRLYDGSALVSSDIYTLTSDFVRYTVSGEMANATVYCYVYAVDSEGADFYYDGGQLEKNPYPTPWHLGGQTRQPDSLYYTLPAPLPAEWFASGVWKPDQGSEADRHNAYFLLSPYYDTNNRFAVAFSSDTNTAIFAKWHGGTPVSLSSEALSWAAGDIIEWAAMQLTQPCGDLAAGMHLWYRVAGGSVVHLSNTDANLPTAPTKAYVGCHASAGYECNGVIDALHLIDVAALEASGTPLNNAWVESVLTSETAPTAGPGTILLANFDDTLGTPDSAGFVWISATKDISSADDSGSGRISSEQTTPGGSSVNFCTRTSDDGTTWDDWVAVDGSGNIQSTYRDYIQVAVTGAVSGSDEPSLQSVTMSYDAEPEAIELASGFTAGGQWHFTTLSGTFIATNMLDAPQKWDGLATSASDLGGSPPHAQYVAVHKNYVFFAHTQANPSRLHFSELLNIESYPVLNFIDISPDDGDWITGLLVFDDYLIITKQRSVWILVGDGESSFEVRRIHSGVGCVAPRTLERMGARFSFVSSEGVYASDLAKPTLLTERLKETWKGLNRRRLSQAAAVYFDHKLRIDVPNGSSTRNNLRIVYDTLRESLSLEEFSNHASCYAKYVEAGQEILLYGHATEGQISQADDGTTDAGEPIAMTWKTKHFNFGSSATLKKVRYLYLAVVPAASDSELNVYFIVDGAEVATPLTATVKGLASPRVVTHKFKPREVGVRNIKTLGYRITQSTTNGGVRIHELLQEYYVKDIEEDNGAS